MTPTFCLPLLTPLHRSNDKQTLLFLFFVISSHSVHSTVFLHPSFHLHTISFSTPMCMSLFPTYPLGPLDIAPSPSVTAWPLQLSFSFLPLSSTAGFAPTAGLFHSPSVSHLWTLTTICWWSSTVCSFACFCFICACLANIVVDSNLAESTVFLLIQQCIPITPHRSSFHSNHLHCLCNLSSQFYYLTK